MSKKFDIKKTDAQATAVAPVKPENFDEYATWLSYYRNAMTRFRQRVLFTP